MAVRAKEIAEYVGVSRPVVSKVLYGGRSNVGVSDATRQRVLDAARELGYRPNTMARAVRQGRFNAIGYLSYGFDQINASSGSPSVITAISRLLAKHQYHLTYAMVEQRDLDEGKLPQVLAESMVDALVLDRSTLLPESIVEAADRFKLPYVAVNTKHAHDCVYPDDWDVARRATQELIELGHRHIGYLGGFRNNSQFGPHYSVEDREAGYCASMTDAGLKPCVVAYSFTELGGNDPSELPRVMASDQAPTAWLAYSLGQAMELYTTALQMGLSVPGDVSIMTIYRGAEGPLMGSMRFDSYTMIDAQLGRCAAEMIMQKLRHPREPIPSLELKFKREAGVTVAPPKV